MAVGVAVANAILLVTFAAAQRPLHDHRRAAVRRGPLRPILMTSLRDDRRHLPMAVGLGEGGAKSYPGLAHRRPDRCYHRHAWFSLPSLPFCSASKTLRLRLHRSRTIPTAPTFS